MASGEVAYQSLTELISVGQSAITFEPWAGKVKIGLISSGLLVATPKIPLPKLFHRTLLS